MLQEGQGVDHLGCCRGAHRHPHRRPRQFHPQDQRGPRGRLLQARRAAAGHHQPGHAHDGAICHGGKDTEEAPKKSINMFTVNLLFWKVHRSKQNSTMTENFKLRVYSTTYYIRDLQQSN